MSKASGINISRRQRLVQTVFLIVHLHVTILLTILAFKVQPIASLGFSFSPRTRNLNLIEIRRCHYLHLRHFNIHSQRFSHLNMNMAKKTKTAVSSASTSTTRSTSTSESKQHGVSIHWFRNGLRLHDNPSLLQACQQSSSVLPLYIIDPDAPFAQTSGRKAGAIRANFILESIKELDAKLKENDSKLVVVLGKPQQVLPQVIEQVGADALYYERETAAPIRELDALVFDELNNTSTSTSTSTSEQEVEIVGFDTHTLHPMEHYLAHCKDQVAPSTYGVFTKIFNKLSVPEEVEDCDLLDHFPPLPSSYSKLESELDTNGECPTLQELGYDEKEIANRSKGGIEFVGGEDVGLALLERMMKRTQWVSTFEKPKTSPNALTVDTTGLSPCKYTHTYAYCTKCISYQCIACLYT